MKHLGIIEFNNIHFEIKIGEPVFYDLEGHVKYNIIQSVRENNSLLHYKVWFENDILHSDHPLDKEFLERLGKVIKNE